MSLRWLDSNQGPESVELALPGRTHAAVEEAHGLILPRPAEATVALEELDPTATSSHPRDEQDPAAAVP